MSKSDPFEAFKNRREIEILEDSFKARAEEQRQRVDDALAGGDEDAAVNNRVDREMEDFFKESTGSVERALEEISGPVTGEAIEDALARAAQEESGASPDDPETPAQPERKTLDLRAALARIRQHQGGDVGTHGDAGGPQAADAVPAPAVAVEAQAAADLQAEPPIVPSPMVEAEVAEAEVAEAEVAEAEVAEAEVAEAEVAEASLIEPPLIESPVVDIEPDPAPEFPAKVKVLQAYDESFFMPPVDAEEAVPVLPEPEVVAPEPEQQEEIRSPVAEPDPEPDLLEPEEPVADSDEPEIPPLLAELTREVRNLQNAFQVLLDKGLVTADEVERGCYGIEPRHDADEELADLNLDVQQLKVVAGILVQKGLLDPGDLGE